MYLTDRQGQQFYRFLSDFFGCIKICDTDNEIVPRGELTGAALAAEEPWWEPGNGHAYHVNTYGFLVGEVLRRVTGRSPGELLRQRVAGPLGADVHLGLPATEDHRVASFLWPGEPPAEAETERDDGQPNEPLELMRYNAYSNPSGLSGAGGALEDITVVDPVALADSGVALGYVMNQLGPRWQKPRNRTLIDAVYQSLA